MLFGTVSRDDGPGRSDHRKSGSTIAYPRWVLKKMRSSRVCSAWDVERHRRGMIATENMWRRSRVTERVDIEAITPVT